MGEVFVSVKVASVKVVLQPKSAQNGLPVSLETIQSPVSPCLVSLEVSWKAVASLAGRGPLCQGRAEERARWD